MPAHNKPPLYADDFLQSIAEDLETLRTDWSGEVLDKTLRQQSALLRRLLVEGELAAAWRRAGFEREPIISCAMLSDSVLSIPSKSLIFAFAGGGTSFGIEMRSTLAVDYAMSESEMKAQAGGAGPPEKRSMGLREFTESLCGYVRGKPVLRRHLVKYVANTRGGTHHAQGKHKPAEKELYDLLDATHGQFQVASRPIVYLEFLSIGQALVESPDITRFIEKVSGNRPSQ